MKNADIELLLTKARKEIEESDKAGDPHRFTDAGLIYGPIAHRVYIDLDVPERAKHYHDSNTRRVLLDPCTVSNRARSVNDCSIDEPMFWYHADMVKTLCDYLDRVYSKEAMKINCAQASR